MRRRDVGWSPGLDDFVVLIIGAGILRTSRAYRELMCQNITAVHREESATVTPMVRSAAGLPQGAEGLGGDRHCAALKEWGAVVRALLDGRQTVLLRKGGIHEKRFEVAAGQFLLFPTSVHSHAERVRPEHRELLAPADSTAEAIVLRAGAKVVATVEVNRPDAIDEIEDLHIWTADSVRADRLDFRPKHRLTVLLVQASPLCEPVRLHRIPDYAGCKSWLDLPVQPVYADPVHALDDLVQIERRVRRVVG